MSEPGPDAPIRRSPPPRWLLRAINPLVRPLLQRSKFLQSFVLVFHFIGRKSGRAYDIPAGYHLVKGAPIVLSTSTWRKNFAGGKEIEVTYQGRRRPARAHLVDDRDEVAAFLEERFAEYGPDEARRRLGFQVDVDRAPSREEWAEAVARTGMSLIRLDFRDETKR
jgi:hypothetical protein